MRMRDRLIGLVESLEEELRHLDMKVQEYRDDIDSLTAKRLKVEEEIVEARLVLNQLDFTGLKVDRTEDGMIRASVDDQTPVSA